MKKFATLLIEQLSLFLGNTVPNTPKQESPYDEILNQIELACYNHVAVHVIYSKQKSITGKIVKWDEKCQQLIVKNFSKKMSAIIPISSIHRISLVPDAITQSQQN